QAPPSQEDIPVSYRTSIHTSPQEIPDNRNAVSYDSVQIPPVLAPFQEISPVQIAGQISQAPVRRPSQTQTLSSQENVAADDEMPAARIAQPIEAPVQNPLRVSNHLQQGPS